MSETLSSHTEVTLFGKIVEDLKIVPEKKGRSRSSGSGSFARIYGFSFEGTYYEMAAPTLFQVEGNGKPAMDATVPGPGLDDDDKFYQSLKTWTCSRNDKTVRLDVDSGTFEQVLLAGMDDGGPGVSGARVSGARVSGARVSGARVSGARVSGARISGARLSGARGDASD